MPTTDHPLERKSPAELRTMRANGRILNGVLRAVAAMVAPGVSTLDLDREAERLIRAAGAVPAFKGLYGFPRTLCTSINEQVVHGIPAADAVLREGDIVSIDCGLRMDGFYADHAVTVAVGRVSEEAQRLLDATRRSLDAAVAAIVPGARYGDIGHAVQSVVEAAGFHVIRDYTGHGIGRNLHEQPQLLNYGEPRTGKRLQPGVVLAIEPMTGAGTGATRQLEDGWTVTTADRSLAAHFEHTVAVTEKGAEILTAP